MGGRAVKVEVIFFDIFTMVALVASQAKQPLFKDGILLIPQGHAEADILEAVTDTA